jgi:hypothetical protein
MQYDPGNESFHAPTQTQARPRCGNTLAFATANLSLFIISIAVLENVLPEAELEKRANFSTLNVGLALKKEIRHL